MNKSLVYNRITFDQLTDLEKEQFEERAAIMEYDGGLPRNLAEKRAFKDIIIGRENG